MNRYRPAIIIAEQRTLLRFLNQEIAVCREPYNYAEHSWLCHERHRAQELLGEAERARGLIIPE